MKKLKILHHLLVIAGTIAVPLVIIHYLLESYIDEVTLVFIIAWLFSGFYIDFSGQVKKLKFAIKDSKD